jgi:hypothetical protein
MDAKRIAQRIGYALSALGYAGLALTAVKLIMGSGGGNSDTTEDLTAQILAQPFGQWLVGLAGSIVIGVGFSYFKQQGYRMPVKRRDWAMCWEFWRNSLLVQ